MIWFRVRYYRRDCLWSRIFTLLRELHAGCRKYRRHEHCKKDVYVFWSHAMLCSSHHGKCNYFLMIYVLVFLELHFFKHASLQTKQFCTKVIIYSYSDIDIFKCLILSYGQSRHVLYQRTRHYFARMMRKVLLFLSY